MLTPTDKGNIAEAKLAAAAIELGIGVCLPIGDGCRYDCWGPGSDRTPD
jgi:hypothetical protein